MSIIHDALKKTQQDSLNDASKKPEGSANAPKKKTNVYLVYAFIACLGLFLSNKFFGLLMDKAKPKTKDEPVKMTFITPEKEPLQDKAVQGQQKKPLAFSIGAENQAKNKSSDSLTLNGIFFSSGEAFALVNNHIVKVGDSVAGYNVKSIEVDSVEFEGDGEITRLSTRGK